MLGAGKCNDLDLGALAGVFDEIHLVDLDRAALASAVSREPPDVRARLVPHAGVDLGLLTNKRAEKWRRKAPSSSDFDALEGAWLRVTTEVTALQTIRINIDREMTEIPCEP